MYARDSSNLLKGDSMRRVVMIVGMVTGLIFAGLFYQYHQQQQDAAQLQQYQTVLYEKTEQLYAEAQDWQNPIQLKLDDTRLEGDYQVMAEFTLSNLKDNAEARNAYLRELKKIGWDDFLDPKRLTEDKKQNYPQTQQMLSQARLLAQNYEQQSQLRQAQALEQAKDLDIQQRLKQTVIEGLKSNQAQDTDAVFALEQQILVKAQAMFEILKAHQWQAQKGQFLFYEDQPLKAFNTLYQEVLRLNAQINAIKQHNKAAVEAKL